MVSQVEIIDVALALAGFPETETLGRILVSRMAAEPLSAVPLDTPEDCSMGKSLLALEG